jgi:tetratricopeptide (TPR) repeat protein
MKARKTKFAQFIFPGVVLMVLIAAGGCSKKSAPQLTAQDYAKSGWARFQDLAYPNALAEFDLAIGRDPSYADGYLGAGWTDLYLNNPQAAQAMLNAGRSRSSDSSTLADFDAGLTLACYESGDYNGSIRAADSCLTRSPQYVFARKTTINRLDMLSAKANAYFQLGADSNLSAAAAVVHEAIPTIDLKPSVPSTWTVNGNRYSSFTEALVRALEKLSGIASSS